MHEKKGGAAKGMLLAVMSALLVLVAKLGCCGLPLLALALGTVGISSEAIGVLKPFQPFFMVLSLVGLVSGFYQVYGRKNKCGCGPGRFQVVSLWLCALLVSGFFLHTLFSAPENKKVCCPPKEKTERQCCPAVKIAEPESCCPEKTEMK